MVKPSIELVLGGNNPPNISFRVKKALKMLNYDIRHLRVSQIPKVKPS